MTSPSPTHHLRYEGAPDTCPHTNFSAAVAGSAPRAGVWAAPCREVSADHRAPDLPFMGHEQCLAPAWALPRVDVWGTLARG